MKQKYLDFIFCIRNHNFYSAHEKLEEIWFPRRFEKTTEVKILKGLINAAVSFELYKQSKNPQSDKTWLTYLKYRLLIEDFNDTDLKYVINFIDDFNSTYRKN